MHPIKQPVTHSSAVSIFIAILLDSPQVVHCRSWKQTFPSWSTVITDEETVPRSAPSTVPARVGGILTGRLV